jgi:hypothetical protein
MSWCGKTSANLTPNPLPHMLNAQIFVHTVRQKVKVWKTFTVHVT